MTALAKIIFFVSLALLAYPVVGYPLVLLAVSAFRKRGVARQPFAGKVSVIVTAHNEEANIADKLKNTLNQDFPSDRLEVIVASDCSTDRTDEIVRSFAHRGILLARADRRGGKEYAQKYAVGKASGDVVVFTDVGTRLDPDGISRITSNFTDPAVGCASSYDRFINPDGRVSGEGLYVRYEMGLRELESRVSSLVGLSGSFFAARSDVCAGIRPDTQSDFQSLLNAVRLGYRGVADAQSVGYYRELAAPQNELRRKMRTVLRGITTLMENADLLNPFRYGLFSFQLISHKLLRWLAPIFLFFMFVSGAIASVGSPSFALITALQAGGYGVALLVFLNRRIASIGPMYLLRYAILSNLGVALAWLKFIRGERIVSWEPSKR
jgi:cellulose synthase/poly-beta-1,6-N-acetylglucosamine synthase-like glycosyltransferase